MKPLQMEKKNDESHCDPAMPDGEIFEFRPLSKRKKAGRENHSEAPYCVKLKYALHSDPFLCFTAPHGFMKTP